MSFLTYWFLRIKWLFAKYMTVTKLIAIHKNRFLQSFKKNRVYSLVTEKRKLKRHNRKDQLSSKFSGKCKKGFHQNFRRSWKILEDQPQNFFGWRRPFFSLTPFISGLFCVKFHGDWCNYFENYKGYVNEFLLC